MRGISSLAASVKCCDLMDNTVDIMKYLFDYLPNIFVLMPFFYVLFVQMLFHREQ